MRRALWDGLVFALALAGMCASCNLVGALVGAL
jgi:hypothetical protein